MGYSTIIDIIGSTIVGGLLLLTLFRLNDQSVKNTYMFSGDLQVQENLTALIQSIEYDFKKIGYCKDPYAFDKLSIIEYADSTKIKFKTDIITAAYPEGDGIPDIMEYKYDLTNDLNYTPNPNDHNLLRIINGVQDPPVNLGVTWFRIKYYSFDNIELNSPVADPSQIYTMQIDMQIENTSAYESEYSTTFWRQIRLVAPILKNVN